MYCPECGNKMHVIDGRRRKKAYRRRRVCGECGKKMFTVELPEDTLLVLLDDQTNLTRIINSAKPKA